jgi:protein involved in polysaccharide export with SLBB domain
MKRTLFIALCAMVIGSRAAFAQDTVPNPTSVPSVATVPADYRLDSDDVILVEVNRHADVTRQVRIAPDGHLRLSRLERPVPVRGLTCAELVAELTQRLTDEGKLRLRPGQVQVVVLSPRPRRLYVRGNAIPGRELDLKNGWRISELLAEIGGVPQPDRVIARLTNPHRPGQQTVDLSAIMADPSSPANIALTEGDLLTIDLPARKRLFVKGEGPRGVHDIDERFGLRQALVQLGFSYRDATGDLRKATLLRRTVPGDPNSPQTTIPVDLYTLLTSDAQPDLALQDLDTLDIPLSQKFVYVYGELGGPRRHVLPEDRPTFLRDIVAMGGGWTGNAKIGSIVVYRPDPSGGGSRTEYDFGKYLKDFKPERNPEIQPGDIVVVPSNRRPDPFQLVVRTVGSVQAFQYLRAIVGF